MRKKIIIFTGAGISAESGLATFRDQDGLWEQYRIEEVATPQAWAHNPALVLDFYNLRRRAVLQAQPNAAHLALPALEAHHSVTIITQNIDDLHERAGSQQVLHLHGEILKARSSSNPYILQDCRQDLHLGDTASDGAQLRPHIVWFGEGVPMMEAAIQITQSADYFVVIGTSLQVYPAASLLQYAPALCKTILIDPQAEHLSASKRIQYISAPATTGVPLWVESMLSNME